MEKWHPPNKNEPKNIRRALAIFDSNNGNSIIHLHISNYKYRCPAILGCCLTIPAHHLQRRYGGW